MNDDPRSLVSEVELDQFQQAMAKLIQCCQEQSAYRSERFGLSETEQRTIMLFGNERYLTAKSLARRLNVAKSRVTKVVAGLVDKGLVQRSPDPADSRYHLLTLTNEGQRRQEEITAFLQAMHGEVLAQLSPTERNELLGSLQRLRSSMEAVKDILE